MSIRWHWPPLLKPMICWWPRAQGVKASETFYPRIGLLSRNHMILGSFLGGCELRISISENTSPESRNISICQSISGLRGWLKSYFVTSPRRVKHRVMCKQLRLLRGPLNQCFWNLRKYSLVPVTALKSSSDEKPPVGASGFPPHSRS